MSSLRHRLFELAARHERYGLSRKSRAQVEPGILLDVSESGELSVNQGRIDPSAATPTIHFSKCVARAYRTEDGNYFEGELVIEGTVRSALCDSLPAAETIFTQLIFTLSDDIRFKPRVIEVHGEKTRANEPLRPFPFEGRFATVLKAIPITGGVNLFYFRAQDPVSQVTAESIWTVSFDLPYDDDDEEAAEPATSSEKPKLEPTVTSPAEEIVSARGVDPVFYCIGLQPTADVQELSFGRAGEKWYPLQGSPALPDLVVPIDPDTGQPLLFTLVPGGSGRARATGMRCPNRRT